jgi:hypothetical protein
MDSFTQNNRLDSLKGTVLKVGFNHNSGGWKGAYSKEKTHFNGPANIWDGPSIQFVREAGKHSKFPNKNQFHSGIRLEADYIAFILLFCNGSTQQP